MKTNSETEPTTEKSKSSQHENRRQISTALILQINKVTFGHLYEWAGRFRNTTVKVGAFIPPEPHQVPNLMYQLADELNHQLKYTETEDRLVGTLAYCHHRMVFIHPFNNGNGRTARLLTNLLAYKNGYKDLNLYYRSGEKREVYIKAIRSADKNDFALLEELIRKELVRF